MQPSSEGDLVCFTSDRSLPVGHLHVFLHFFPVAWGKSSNCKREGGSGLKGAPCAGAAGRELPGQYDPSYQASRRSWQPICVVSALPALVMFCGLQGSGDSF